MKLDLSYNLQMNGLVKGFFPNFSIRLDKNQYFKPRLTPSFPLFMLLTIQMKNLLEYLLKQLLDFHL